MFGFLKIKLRLKKKIFLAMALVGIAPFALLALLALYNLNRSHEADVMSIEKNIINQKKDEIQSYLEAIQSTFQLRVSFEQISDIEISNQQFLLKQLTREIPVLEEVAFINLEGQETAKISRYFGEDIVPEEYLKNQSEIKKFKQAKIGRDYISSVYFTINGPMVTLASPVLNKNGIVISILTGEIYISELQKIVEKTHLGEIGYLYLTDEDGFLIAHSESEKMSLAEASFKSVAFVNQILNGYESFALKEKNRYESFWGEPVVSWGEKFDDTGWGIITEWPTSDADRVLNIIKIQVLFFAFIIFVLTIFFSFFITKRIVGPVKQLQASTQLVAKGVLDQPIVIKTGDEIEDLGGAFNQMMEGLKQLDELKKEFVFIAAHELRTPVTAIKGYLSMILDGLTGEINVKTKEFIQKVMTANERLVQLVNDLLQIARAEAGKLTVQVSAIDVIQPIQEVLSELKPLADEKNIAMKYEVANWPKAMADTGRLKEVMVNLIGNAIKYTIGSGVVTIFHETKDKFLITHIKDTGLGISKEAQGKLFEKFYRVQTEQTATITGTGLGLFIVKQIVEKMNGKIWVESEEGKGSVFSFSLPLAGD